ncbi:MAG TPA: PrgI family protein, partial [Candidatus Saccharimonadales bacterium]|nr:PrgI family protein [Candidatus Saccharimonadales bacterium]
MAQYKVIQDVEAEDKLLGPLTLRQFIYAGVTAITLYLSYFAATHHATFLLAIFVPFAAITGFFAFPWGRDQPTEVWALAKIRFMLKPRRRIWDQSGTKNLVTVTAPKKMHVDYTNGLSETEVRSRLHALADTIDSRGWAIKNANLNLYAQPALVMGEPTSDRLVSASALPHEVSDIDVQAADDILDEKNNARAQAVDTMIEASAKAHREQIVQNLKQSAQIKPEPPRPAAPQQQQNRQGQGGNGNPGDPNYRSNDYWVLNQPSRAAEIPANMVTFNTQVVTPGMNQAPSIPAPAPIPAPSAADEQNLVQALEARRQEMPTT